MKRRDFFKGTAAGLATGSALSFADLLGKIKPKIVRQTANEPGPIITSDIGMFINGHRLEVLSISGPSATVDIDVTSLDAQATEIRPLPDYSEVEVTALLTDSEASNMVYHARAEQELLDCKIRLSDEQNSTISFSCYINTYEIGIGIDETPTVSMNLRITGVATMT